MLRLFFVFRKLLVRCFVVVCLFVVCCMLFCVFGLAVLSPLFALRFFNTSPISLPSSSKHLKQNRGFSLSLSLNLKMKNTELFLIFFLNSFLITLICFYFFFWHFANNFEFHGQIGLNSYGFFLVLFTYYRNYNSVCVFLFCFLEKTSLNHCLRLKKHLKLITFCPGTLVFFLVV